MLQVWQQWRQARWQRCDMAFLSSHVLLGLCLGFALYVGRAWQAQEAQIQQTMQQQQLATQSQAKAVQAWTAHTALAAQIRPWVAQGALGNAPLLRWDELLASFQETMQPQNAATTNHAPALTWQFLPPGDFVEQSIDQTKNQPINKDGHSLEKIDQIAEPEKQAGLRQISRQTPLQFVTLTLHGAAEAWPELLTWLSAKPSQNLATTPKHLPAELRRLEWEQGQGGSGSESKANRFTAELRLVHLPSPQQGKQP